MASTGTMTMSMRELERLKIVQAVVNGNLKPGQAAQRLGLTVRQVQRLVNRYRMQGAVGLVSDKRGRHSNHQLAPRLASQALTIIRDRYADFEPTLACEKLGECYGIRIGTETVRQLMMEAGLWIPRALRSPTIYQPRNRRHCIGELIQIDGSDQASVFRVNSKQARGGDGHTQFGRALYELNIESICANSSQAKGRVERANLTLQDRLVKELRLRNISTMEGANAYTPCFVDDFNRRFAKPPPRNDWDAHRPVREDEDLALVFTVREKRKVSHVLNLQYDKIMSDCHDLAQTHSDPHGPRDADLRPGAREVELLDPRAGCIGRDARNARRRFPGTIAGLAGPPVGNPEGWRRFRSIRSELPRAAPRCNDARERLGIANPRRSPRRSHPAIEYPTCRHG